MCLDEHTTEITIYVFILMCISSINECLIYMLNVYFDDHQAISSFNNAWLGCFRDTLVCFTESNSWLVAVCLVLIPDVIQWAHVMLGPSCSC